VTRGTAARRAQERVPRLNATSGLPQARSFASLCAEADEATDWLLVGYLAREYVTLLYAKPTVGKSELTYNLIAASQQGEEFLGQRIRPLRVVYLSEEPPRSIRQKVERLGIDASRIVGLCRKDTVRRQFDFAAVLRWAKAAAKADPTTKQPKADLIVIDTLAFWAKLPPEATARQDCVEYAQRSPAQARTLPWWPPPARRRRSRSVSRWLGELSPTRRARTSPARIGVARPPAVKTSRCRDSRRVLAARVHEDRADGPYEDETRRRFGRRSSRRSHRAGRRCLRRCASRPSSRANRRRGNPRARGVRHLVPAVEDVCAGGVRHRAHHYEARQ